MSNKNASFYIENIPANKHLANKTIEIVYKEYEAVTNTEDNTVEIGKFLEKKRGYGPYFFAELLDYCLRIARYAPNPPYVKKIFDKSLRHFTTFTHKSKIVYDEKGLIKSYLLDTFAFRNILFNFQYNTKEQLTQWTATIENSVIHTRKFFYYENGMLQRRIKDSCGYSEEWRYDKNGELLQYIQNWGKDIKTINYDPNEKEEESDTDELIEYDETGAKIVYHEKGNKEVIHYDENGRIVEIKFFEIYYKDFRVEKTITYKFFDGKVERTTINADREKTIILFKDFERKKMEYYTTDLEGKNNILLFRDVKYKEEPDDSLDYDRYDENVFSCTQYDENGNETKKYIRTYLENGLWETVYYEKGVPKSIIRKEYNIFKNLNYMYTQAFKEAVAYCKANNLFVGYGNPNGKVLVIGKEAAHIPQEETIENLEKKKEELFQSNVSQWEHILSTNEVPNYDGERPISHENPLYAYGNQFNKRNIRKEGKPYNDGTSSTYLNYEKLYEELFLQGEKLERINFQKEFFITEFSDYPTKESYKNEDIEALRKQSIEERKPLFAMPFFKEFPIVIVAANDYPRRYQIDLEQTFNVKWEGKTTEVGNKNWYNLHFSKDNKRILIHTRQLSNGVSNKLITAIANEAKKFLK